MSIRKLLQAGLFGLAVVAFSGVLAVDVVADEEEEEEETPVRRPPPPPAPPRPPPPQARPAPPPPQRIPAPEPVVVPEDEPLSGFWLQPEAVYWKFPDSDVAYARSSGGEVFSVDDDYELGGRLGLGYRWANHFDVIVRATSVENDQDGFASGALTTRHGAAVAADAFVDVDYLTIDGEIGYTWGEPDRSRFRLAGGPRYVSIEQGFLIQSFDAGSSLPKGSTFQEIEFDGVGLKVGGEGHVGFGESGWSFFLGGAVTGVDGNFDTFFDGDGDGIVDATDAARSFDDTVFAWEAAAGFAWHHLFGEGSLFGLRFGYEVVEWTDVPTFFDDHDAATRPTAADFDGSGEDFSGEGAFFGVEWIF